MVEEQAIKIAKKRKVSKVIKQRSAAGKKQGVALFKASLSKVRHLGNYKAFVKHLLSDDEDVDFDAVD